MVTPESKARRYYDFVVCYSMETLKDSIAQINYHGFEIVAVTETNTKYTIFYLR